MPHSRAHPLPRPDMPAMISLLAVLLSVILASCSSLPFFSGAADEAVIYALGPRDGFRSPI